MIDPIKIKVKGFPASRNIDFEFYNEKDLMSTIVIYINGFPTFISESFKLGLMKFHQFSNAKLRINVKPTNPAIFKIAKFDSYINKFAILKIKTKIQISTSFNSFAYGHLNIYGTASSNFKLGSKIKGLIKLKSKDLRGAFKAEGIYLEPDKVYSVRNDKTLGYWDDFTLEEMDDLDNFELAGTIVG